MTTPVLLEQPMNEQLEFKFRELLSTLGIVHINSVMEEIAKILASNTE